MIKLIMQKKTFNAKNKPVTKSYYFVDVIHGRLERSLKFIVAIEEERFLYVPKWAGHAWDNSLYQAIVDSNGHVTRGGQNHAHKIFLVKGGQYIKKLFNKAKGQK